MSTIAKVAVPADEFASERGLSVELEKIHRVEENRHGRFGLTDAQYETLVAALERGYYEIPREMDMDHLSDVLGISTRRSPSDSDAPIGRSSRNSSTSASRTTSEPLDGVDGSVGGRPTLPTFERARMDEDMLEDQRRLVELVEEEGWDVTDLEISAYDSPWADEDDPEASVTITARKPYESEEDDGGEDDESPFRVK